MLSKSRFNRRLHRVKALFLSLFSLLGEQWKDLNTDSLYAIDTFPVAACDNYRIKRCHLYQGEAYRGFIASKKRYFYGLKIHWEPWERYWIHLHRKMIETTGSLIERILPKSIHTVTSVGFELKVSLFILAMSFSYVFKVAT